MMTEEEYEVACKRADELANKAILTKQEAIEYENLLWDMMLYDEQHRGEDVQDD